MHSIEIRYFLTVATTGSLSAASQQLFVAVSAISRQIHRLESRIGVPLFERRARGMALTDAGRILESHIRKSLLDMEQAMAEIQGLEANRPTCIRVGATEGLAFDLLPVLFARFRARHPAVSFLLKTGSSLQISHLVRNGEVDVGLRFVLTPEQGVDVAFALPAPMLLLMAADHPLARRGITLNDLHDYPLALAEPSTTLRQLFDLTCRINGVFLEPALCCNNLSALYSYTLNTPLAIAACSLYSVLYKCRQDAVCLRELNARQLERRALQIHTMSGRQMTAPVGEFIDFAGREMREAERWHRRTLAVGEE
ncbi:LysR family transcriptional regulator [Affinibrenneria salicis]|uniref:LysR family transcriptional regulator n=1 Tax=Affinibrenneria salicis TaxID=2590031 RepID=A0A5J5G4M0_9GAMM|nr:LysR family transcriptional regulator [Affinibrenneria salicis]KAA9001948.1 LysR family transcriptional regulator [Affinibrenneria salicis]